MMTHLTTYQPGAPHTVKMTTSLRDGLITLIGLIIALGSLLNQEITMWWIGA
jgi:hypothetical protein